ncbi:MAG: type II toxin-antitoxin system RelE/ParE family toxin [Acidimicrobiales bacterium]|nr:MAG: type II toxin-antitoxin system RelE/ParE family toxin [Acidimicrobiales bacterium]
MDRLAVRSTKMLGAIVEFAYGPLADHPEKVGGPLTQDLQGLYRAVRGTWRVLYSFDDQEVRIEHVGHRSNVYRTR